MTAFSAIHQGQPIGVLLAAPVHLVEVQRLEALGDGTRAAVADDASVHLADGRDLGRGAREEAFVGDVDLVAGDALLLDRDPDLGT
jgi:hypothetical protein